MGAAPSCDVRDLIREFKSENFDFGKQLCAVSDTLAEFGIGRCSASAQAAAARQLLAAYRRRAVDQHPTRYAEHGTEHQRASALLSPRIWNSCRLWCIPHTPQQRHGIARPAQRMAQATLSMCMGARTGQLPHNSRMRPP